MPKGETLNKDKEIPANTTLLEKGKMQLEQYMVFTLPVLLPSKKEKTHIAARTMFDSWNQGSGTAFVMN